MAIWFVHESQNVYNVECVDHSFGEKGKNVNWQKRHTKQQKKKPRPYKNKGNIRHPNFINEHFVTWWLRWIRRIEAFSHSITISPW